MAYAKRVSDAQFVTIWMQCSNYDQLIEKLGMAKCSIHARVCRLRGRGVNLPPKRERAKSSVESLNEIIANLTPAKLAVASEPQPAQAGKSHPKGKKNR